ncbi:methyl-accepting chemotaxis protein [Halarcobacter ebronensis]|uniref:Chemotaxis protein n=1 Tax=Halarcobacter ebronensis TaxID=1462615 RepID=A0A4Q1APJ6_9BACT|nr:methyl-accepting chemotaxis protein [Halarcobacter ebronensis]QKF81308.1 Cache sensor-containing MCP-domain signal transduction protein [Halarcobacter ebronensis]RXK04873.1 chemotaxis protein [Halarcobacter ebronensis]
MKKRGIKTKILVLLFISISISFFVLGFNSIKSKYDMHFSTLKDKEIAISKESSQFIYNYLQSKIDILKAVADELPQEEEKLNIDNPEILKELILASKAGNFFAVFVGFEKNGYFVKSDKEKRTPQTTDYDPRKRGWYIEAVKKDAGGVTEPYIDYSTGKLVVSIYYPLKREGKIAGVVSSDIFIDTITNSIKNIKFKESGFAYLVNEKGDILIHKNKKLVNEHKKSESFIKLKQNNTTNFGEINDNNGKELFLAFSPINLTSWYSVVQLDKKEIVDEIIAAMIDEAIIYVILLVMILLLLFFSMIKLLAPLKSVEDGLENFFKYLKGEIEEAQKLNIKTVDEFGSMGKAIDKEIEEISKQFEKDKELIDDVKKVVSDVKNGLLNVEVKKSTSNKSLNELKDILNDMIITINNNVNSDINPILSKLEDYAKLNFKEDIPNANGNIAKGLNNLCLIINQMLQANKSNGLTLEESSKLLLENVDVLNKSSNDTAVSLEETAAALEEITSTVINNTNRIQEMSNHSNELSLSIKEGQELANSTVTSMDEINEQTQAIAEAITVIDQIAFQTNILSLNAAVEAATAGEAGKGFAVVAQEVRNLASRSAEAAKEIKDLVENATLKTDNGKKIADKMIEGYKKLNNNIKKATEAINDISEASKEQKTSIEQINDVVTRLDRQSQNNASVANQAHQIAENTSKIAFTILEEVNKKVFREN